MFESDTIAERRVLNWIDNFFLFKRGRIERTVRVSCVQTKFNDSLIIKEVTFFSIIPV